MWSYKGEQANKVYDYLAGLPAGRGTTTEELMRVADASQDRVRQILAQVRRGTIMTPGQYNACRPALNIHYHRATGMYYNLSNISEEAVEEHVPAGVIEEIVANILARGDSLKQVLGVEGGGVLEQLEANEDDDRIKELLSQVPMDKLEDVLELFDDIRGAKLLLEQRTRTRR